MIDDQNCDPDPDKATMIRNAVEACIDSLDNQIVQYVTPSWQFIGDIARYRVDMVAYLNSLSERPVKPWESKP